MNKATVRKRLAMNYAILRTILQDDERLNTLITRTNLDELIDVQRFYETYVDEHRFILDNPVVFKLLERQAMKAFKELRPQTRILHRFEAEYPLALRQDFQAKAPLFLYVYGDQTLLDRKRLRCALVTTLKEDEHYIAHVELVHQQLQTSVFVPILQNRSDADQTLVQALDASEHPYVLLLNHPILKSPLQSEGLRRSAKTLISFVGPMDGVMVEYQRLKVLNSLSHVTVLISDQANDVHHFSIQNNLAWRKPSILPLVKPEEAIAFEGLTLLNHPHDLASTLARFI
jgi:hypothetical protein